MAKKWHIEKRYYHSVAKGAFTKAEKREVILMAVAKKYAMVRRPNCIPYVCEHKHLTYKGE